MRQLFDRLVTGQGDPCQPTSSQPTDLAGGIGQIPTAANLNKIAIFSLQPRREQLKYWLESYSNQKTQLNQYG